MPTMMRAYALRQFDEPPHLTQVPVPEPRSGEVLVRVRTSSVNPVDAATGAGFFRSMQEHRLPAVLGRDLAGTVEAVGDAVTRFAPGDEVVGMVKRSYVGDGTFAEFVNVPEDEFIVHRPDELTLADAGALGLAGVTALQSLDAVAVDESDLIFLNGATGGVGAFVLQLASAAGIKVVATARPGDEEHHVHSLGATETVDWSSGDVVDQVRTRHPQGVDAVIDLVSRGPDAFRSVAALARTGGVAVSTLGGAAGWDDPERRAENIHSAGDPVLLQRLVDLAASGALSVPIVDTFTFDRIEEAFAALRSGPLGKIALTLP